MHAYLLKLSGLWRPRKESVEACAQRAHRFFKELRASSPRFKQWLLPGSSKKKALEGRVDIANLDTLTKLLLKGRNRKDVGRQVIEELGFSIVLWNGAKQYKDEAGVTVHCGAYCELAGMPKPNNVSIGFPVVLEEFADWRQMAMIMKGAAVSWEPDFLTIFSNHAQSARPFGYPFVDWMLYLPDSKYQMPKSLPAAHVERVGNLGTIVVVQEEPPDPENDEHNRNIERVRDALGLTPE